MRGPRGRSLAGSVLAGSLLAGSVLATSLLATSLLAASAVAGPLPVGSARAAPSPSATDAPVTVTVTTLEPRAPARPDQTLRLAGFLTNVSTQALSRLQVRLAVGSVIDTRSGLALADSGPPATSPVGDGVPPATDLLPPGGRVAFDLRLHVGDLRMSRLGVYPVEVRVRGIVGNENRRTNLGQVASFVPWFAGLQPARTRIAWLWPLVDQPRQDPHDALVDDTLAGEVSGAGRLRRLLQASAAGSRGACDGAPARSPVPCRHDPVPVTFAVDPDLLYSLDSMSRPYDVRDPGGHLRRHPASGPAREWLASLREQATRGKVLALPFADPDLVALSRTTGLRDELSKAQRLGTETSLHLLGQEPLGGLAWPPAGRLTPASLDALVDGGASSVLIDQIALNPPPDDGRTPGTRGLLPATNLSVNGLVVDDGLSRLLQPATGWPGPRLAEQRWLAETAIIASERPSEARTLVVAPPRRADLVPAFAAEAMADTGRLPWLCPVALAEVVSGRESCPGQPRPALPRQPEYRGGLQPADDPGGELSRTYLAGVGGLRAQSDQLTDEVLVANNRQQVSTRLRLLRARVRAESSAWRQAPHDGARLLGLLSDDVNDLRGKVQVTAGRRVTLTSDTGTIRVSVVNRLDQPVNVGVELSASNQARLSTTRTPVVQVPPGVSEQISATAHTLTSGQFVVQATLLDREGRPFGASARFAVRSTRYGRVALAVTGLGVGVLLAAAGVRIVRRALRRPADPAET